MSKDSRCHSMFCVGCSMLDVPRGSWKAPFRFLVCIGTMNLIGTPLPALSPQGGERVAEGPERGGSWRASTTFLSRIGTMNRCASQRRGPDRGSATRSLLGSWKGLGRWAPSIELARLIGIPSPLPYPHSSVVGRGNRPCGMVVVSRYALPACSDSEAPFRARSVRKNAGFIWPPRFLAMRRCAPLLRQ